MTPEELENLERFFASLDPWTTARCSRPCCRYLAATTNITINMPPGVTGEQVVDALTEYAQTEGATVCRLQFVNT